jgi:hypothetical protein
MCIYLYVVSCPKLLDGVRQNFVLEVCTESIWASIGSYSFDVTQQILMYEAQIEISLFPKTAHYRNDSYISLK